MSVPAALAAFVARCRAAFPDFMDCRYNTVVHRWEIVTTSSMGKPVSQFFGWFQNPLTGARLEPDPVTGLVPFRDLDLTAQEEMFQSLLTTGLDNRHDGAGSMKAKQVVAREHNKKLDKAQRKARAEALADIISEVDLRRPWVKHHPHAKDPRSRRMASHAYPH